MVLEIMHRLDYTCFPKILHTNRELRAWVLDNWVLILRARPRRWKYQIPGDVQLRLNVRYFDLPETWAKTFPVIWGRDAYGPTAEEVDLKRTEYLNIAKAVLLRGAEMGSLNSAGQTCLYHCVASDFPDLAYLRNLVWFEYSSC